MNYHASGPGLYFRSSSIHACLPRSIPLLFIAGCLVGAQELSSIRQPREARSTMTSAPASSPSASNPPKKHHHKPGLGGIQVNFYYIGVAVFALFLGFCLWLFHVRRRRRKLAQIHDAGHDALARDIDGMPYPNNRRWVAGARRGEGGFFTVRDEGLDEQGEAPPPYKSSGPAEGSTVLVGPDVAGAPAYEGSSADTSVAVPLQTFQRDTPNPKPPDYERESLQNSEPRTGSNNEQSSAEATTSEQSIPGASTEAPSGYLNS